jgi:CBS domain-containing protein
MVAARTGQGVRIMGLDFEDLELASDEEYFAPGPGHRRDRRFDASLLREPLTVLHHRTPLLFSPKDSASEAMRAMQGEHRGCVLVSEDASSQSRLLGIFTERDVLNRVIDGGRNPAHLSLGEIMTADPECLRVDASIAWALNKMEVGGFRHVPVVDEAGRPQLVVSVRDIVAYLVAAFPEEILNLPPDLGRDRYRERDGA